MNVNKLRLFLQKYPRTILTTYTKMIFTLSSIQLHKNKKNNNDLINNYYSILILNKIQKQDTFDDNESF